MVRGCRELWDVGTATVVGPALEGSFVLKSSGPANTLFDQTLSMSKASRQEGIRHGRRRLVNTRRPMRRAVRVIKSYCRKGENKSYRYKQAKQ